MATFGERMLGAARLDGRIYEEVERDTKADTQAIGVVVMSSVAAGLGAGAGLRGLIFGTVAALALWAIWAALVYWVGTSLLPESDTRADWGQVARTVGFAQAPAVVDVWVLIATVVAVRQALDYRSWPRALGVCAIGWGIQLIAFAILRRMLV